MNDLPEQLGWMDADNRGRVYLGPKYKNKNVKVAVMEVKE